MTAQTSPNSPRSYRDGLTIPVKCDQGLPLLVVQLWLARRIRLSKGCLLDVKISMSFQKATPTANKYLVVDFNTFCLNHHETSIDAFDFSNQLLL